MKSETRGTGRAATIVDIARAAGVSKSTVSLVLRSSHLVRPETRAAVQRAMAQLGYVYNRGAASLRTSSTRFIGMIINDLMNPFFAELASGIGDAIYDIGCVPLLATTSESVERQAQVARTMREHGVAGVIMSPARGTTAWHLAEIAALSTPIVVMMRQIEGSRLSYVGPDNRAGARRATEHLIGLGHRDIGFAGGHEGTAAQRERVRGYRDALSAAGLRFNDALVFEAAPTRMGGREAASAALTAERRPTALLCYNDVVAIGAELALSERGLRAGADMAIVGFDNIQESASASPPLTTVDVHTRQLGAKAAELLLAGIDGSSTGPLECRGETDLVIRRSCGAKVDTLDEVRA